MLVSVLCVGIELVVEGIVKFLKMLDMIGLVSGVGFWGEGMECGVCVVVGLWGFWGDRGRGVLVFFVFLSVVRFRIVVCCRVFNKFNVLGLEFL